MMKSGGWARPPLILGLILGTIVENRFLLSMRTHDGIGWLANPIVLIVLALGILTIVLSMRSTIRSNARTDTPQTGEGRARNPVMSLPVSTLFLAVFAGAGWMAWQWELEVGQFPLVMAVPGVLLAATAVLRDARSLVSDEDTGRAARFRDYAAQAMLDRSLRFLGWLAAIIAATLVIGQKLALPIFVFAYLVAWGRFSARVAAAYAIVVWVLMFGFYDRVIRLFFHEPLMAALLAGKFPGWIPEWLVL